MQPLHALKTPFFVSYLTIVNTGIGTSTFRYSIKYTTTNACGTKHLLRCPQWWRRLLSSLGRWADVSVLWRTPS